MPDVADAWLQRHSMALDGSELVVDRRRRPRQQLEHTLSAAGHFGPGDRPGQRLVQMPRPHGKPLPQDHQPMRDPRRGALAGRRASAGGRPWPREIFNRPMKFGQARRRRLQARLGRRGGEIGLAGHPRGKLPQVAAERNVRLALAGFQRNWSQAKASLAPAPQHRVNEAQFGRPGIVRRPAAETKRPRFRLHPPEPRAAEAAGPAKGQDVRWTDHRRIRRKHGKMIGTSSHQTSIRRPSRADRRRASIKRCTRMPWRRSGWAGQPLATAWRKFARHATWPRSQPVAAL